MNANDSPPARTTNRRRRLWIGALLLIFIVVGVAWGVRYMTVGRYQVETDDAYVQSHVVQVTPQAVGTVQAVLVDDTQFVRAGDPLVRLDPADAEVALEQAKAGLAQTVREARVTFANNGTLAAAVSARKADIGRQDADQQRAQADLARAQADLARRRSLVKIGGVSGEELQHARTAESTARAALAAAKAAGAAAASALAGAREQLVTNQALTDNTTVETHPNVLGSAARVREALLALDRVRIDAPVTGFVARRSVQIGQRVAAGAPLMVVVPLDQVWVDANFKESQLSDMRIGQPVQLSADLYGRHVEYRGRVAGLAAGTGAAFSILPAQNATGNWIKIVQRVPVRIELDAEQVKQHPLRVGLSMVATVDTHERGGSTLAIERASSSSLPADAAAAAPVSAQPSAAVAGRAREAQAIIDAIIAANLPGSAAESKAAIHALTSRPSATAFAPAKNGDNPARARVGSPLQALR